MWWGQGAAEVSVTKEVQTEEREVVVATPREHSPWHLERSTTSSLAKAVGTIAPPRTLRRSPRINVAIFLSAVEPQVMDSTLGIARGLLVEVGAQCARREEPTTSSPRVVAVAVVTRATVVQAEVQLVRTAVAVGEEARRAKVELKLPEEQVELVRMGTQASNTREVRRDSLPEVRPRVVAVAVVISVAVAVETMLAAAVDRVSSAPCVACNQGAPRQETGATPAPYHP